jgi:hypothetical protein
MRRASRRAPSAIPMFSRFFKKDRPTDQRVHYRRSPGKKAALGVKLVLPTGEVVPGDLLDVSAGGAAIRFADDVTAVLEIEGTYELRFTSLTKGNIRVQSSIRSGPRDGAPNRFGFQFLDTADLFRQLDDSFYKFFNRRRWMRAQPALDRRVKAELAFGEFAIDLDVHDLSREGVSFVVPDDVAEMLTPDTSLEIKIPVPRTEVVVTFYGLVAHKSRTPQGLRVGCSLSPVDSEGGSKRAKKDHEALEEFIAKRVEEMERYNTAFQ